VLVFSMGMRVEFFIGSFIEPRPLTYAVTHQPIMFLLAGFLYLAAGVPAQRLLDPLLLCHQAASFGGLFAFEIARKLRAPEDETATELTYSKAHGQKRAAAVAALLLLAATVGAAACASWFLLVIGLAAVAYAVYAFMPTRKNAKLQNLVTSLALLAIHAALTATLFTALPQVPGAPSLLSTLEVHP
jgi:cbb3-type cytochrome oxidase subunit 3